MAITGSQKAYKDARFGIARFGASRFGYYRPSFRVSVAGVEKSGRIATGTMRITKNYNGTPWMCTFTTTENPGFVPASNQQVIVGFGDLAYGREFKGSIIHVKHRRKKATVCYDVTCIDGSRRLDHKLVTAGFRNTSATDIALYCIRNFSSGFTTNNIQTELPIIADFPITNERLTQVLRRLVQAMGGGGSYIDAYDDVHLFKTLGEGGFRALSPPQTISDSVITLDEFSYDDDASQQRTDYVGEGRRTTCPIGTPDGETSVVVSASVPVEYLIAAGGGAGGGVRQGGGAGGGVKTGTYTFPSGAVAVTIGNGGTSGNNGQDSSVGGLVALGGGKGGSTGSTGGSGGGSSGTNAGAAGTAGQGNKGGDGNFALSAAGGGGGGAGAPGSNAGPNTGGNGGAGVPSSISGTLKYYGPGGGGSGDSVSGTGGTGGGGNAGAGGNPGTDGTANTGGGGGAGNNYSGGSGIVHLRYLTGSATATGGTITFDGAYTVHTFTSNGTFTISDVTVTAPPPTVTDLPLEDITILDPDGGVLRIGTQLVTYTSLGGPKDPGVNPPSSTLTADVDPLDTSLPVADVSVFTDSFGWVKVGEQIVRYSSVGASSLDGIPALGFGALAGSCATGATVTRLGSVNLSTGTVFSPALAPSTEVVQRIEVHNATAAAALQAAEGIGDGIRQSFGDDDRLTVSGHTTRGQADISGFGFPLVVAQWETRDMNAQPACTQPVSRTTPDALNTTLIITQVVIGMKYGPNYPPQRLCTGSIVRLPDLIDVTLTDKR